MNTNYPTDTWCSLHIFFNGNIYSVNGDIVINKVIQPFISYCKENALIQKYFFIRYNELGPHIRLRLNCSQEYFHEKILPRFKQFIDSSFPNEIVPVIKNDGEEVKKYLLIQYIPELERYGGPVAVKIAEDYFFFSSETVLNLLKSNQVLEPSSRLAKGLISMLILLYIFTKDRNISSVIMNNYNNSYLKALAKEENVKEAWNNVFKNGFDKQSGYLSNVIESVWSAMEDSEELPEPWNSFLNNMENVKSDLQSVFNLGKVYFGDHSPTELLHIIYRVIPSYIHMMNNRFGIPITDESYLAFLINSSLKQKVKIQQ